MLLSFLYRSFELLTRYNDNIIIIKFELLSNIINKRLWGWGEENDSIGEPQTGLGFFNC